MDFEKEAREIVAGQLCLESCCTFIDARSCGCFQVVVDLARRAYTAGQKDAQKQLGDHFAFVSRSAPIHEVQLSDAARNASDAVRHFKFLSPDHEKVG